MKAIPLFSLELRRLLLSRLTWLIALLTLLSPLAGLTLYKPASAGTMLSMYLANPALAGGAAGGVLFGLLAVFELLKALFFFLLCFYGAKLWLVVILVGAFTVQGTLAMLPDSESGKPFLAISEENHKKIGIAAAVIYVLLMLAFPVGIIAAGAAVYFIATGFRRYFLHEFGGVTANWITLAGAITESVLLLVGILLALHVGH